MDQNQRPQSPSLYRWFLMLAFAQFFLLIVVAHLGPGRSARRAESFAAENVVQCADQSAPARLPLNFPMTTLHCEGTECRHSRYVQPGEQTAEMETHIIAVESGKGLARGPQWPRIDVSLESTQTPIRLVLSSKKSVQWDLRGVPDSLLSEVHVVTPQAARITGLNESPDIKLYWHGEDTLCVYPYSWWEVDNPDNEYQRFLSSLRALLSAEEASFQGTRFGESFRVPFYESREDEVQHVVNFRKKWRSAQRTLASTGSGSHFGPVYGLHNNTLKDLGWGQVDAASGQVTVLEEIPKNRTLLHRREDGKFLLLTDGFRLLIYDPTLKTERALPSPLGMTNFSRLHLARFNSAGDKVTAYFRDRGGVVEEWDGATAQWTRKFSFYRQNIEQWSWGEKTFWGVALKKNVVQLFKFDLDGRKVDQREYLLPGELGGARTRLTLDKQGKGFVLKHFSSSRPEGHWYYLGASGEVHILSH